MASTVLASTVLIVFLFSFNSMQVTMSTVKLICSIQIEMVNACLYQNAFALWAKHVLCQ